MGRVVLADDHPLFRRGLAEAVANVASNLEVVEVHSLVGLVAELRSDPDVDLVLLDLGLSDCSGFAGLRTLRERFPAIAVAIVSASEDDHTIKGALSLGALGFIPKSVRISELSEALRKLLAGCTWSPVETAQPMGSPDGILARAGLTPAQMRIMSGLSRGLLNKQIAFEMGITLYTVKAHMTAAFRKLGVANRVQALLLLKDSGGPQP